VRTLRRLRVWFSEGVSMMAVAVQGPPEGASDAIRIHSKSIEEATDQVGRVFHPHELTRVERVSRFHADLEAVSTGPIVSGRLQYHSNSDLYCPAIDGYHVNVPLSGQLISISRGVQTLASPQQAVVYEADSDARILSPEDSRLNMFAMKIERSAVQSALQELLGRPVNGPIDLRGPLDLACGDGKAWWTLVTDIHRGQLAGPLMASPIMVKPLAYATVVGLLSIAEHSYSEALHAEGPPMASAVIRRAADYIVAHAGDPLTPSEIAAAVGVSVRSLQRGFREFYQCTPNEYLRSVRLRRVHEDLVNALPDTTSVASAASKWGFYHHGRFAADYRRTFGVSPSYTLRHS
jgi:AraC-like DNA-binding protein